MKGKSLTLIGTALTLALTANFAVAQSSKSQIAQSSESSTSSPTEIQLSPEGFEILCKRFPLNSRCQGNSAVTPSGSSNTTVDTQPASSETPATTAPDSTTLPAPSETPATTAPDSTTLPAPSETPETTAPGSTTLPAPSETPVTPAPG
ncbi:hypothetical protein GNE08_25130, partial [Trichormus variabilis ARAD]|uniref:hypothetical protein n=1 Tax=Anabaena variabilis TaxID=264691 RepID=UPI001628B377